MAMADRQEEELRAAGLFAAIGLAESTAKCDPLDGSDLRVPP